MWLPISTAPKIGIPFLAYCPANPDSKWWGHEVDRYAICYYSISGHLFEDVTQIGLNDEDAQEDGQRYFEPTHWCELPQPPEKQ